MSTPALSNRDLLRARFNELPKEEAKLERDPTLRRYIFNPFHEQRLDSLLARHSGFYLVPAGVIFAIEAQRYQDTNYAAIGLSELLDANESVNQPDKKAFIRQPGIIASSLVSIFGGTGANTTGFCTIEPLTGVEDEELIFDMQDFFLPRRFPTLGETIEHLEALDTDVRGMQPPWFDVYEVIKSSFVANEIWCNERLEATKASIEERAGGGTGKRQPSELDKEICAWLGVQPPRALSKLDLAKKPESNVATPQQAAAQQAPAEERVQCRICGERVALIDGVAPELCRFCGHNPLGVHQAQTEAKIETAAEESPIKPGNKPAKTKPNKGQ